MDPVPLTTATSLLLREGLVFASECTPSFWKAYSLLPAQLRSCLLTFYFDVYITPAGSGIKDAHLRAITELSSDLLPLVGKELERSKEETGNLLVEVCVDWQTASSFVLPNLISLEALEKELGPIFKQIDLGNRFLLKMTFVSLPDSIVYKQIKSKSSGSEALYEPKLVNQPLIPESKTNNSLSISDCFRIVEKSRFSSSSHLKLVYELKLTKEAALRGFPGNRAWFLLLSDLISSSFEQLPVKKAVNLTISIGRTAVTMECPWTDDMDIYQLGVLLWTLAVEGNKKASVTLIFHDKTRPSHVDDISDFIQKYAAMMRPLFSFCGNNYEDQLSLTTNFSLPEEVPGSFSNGTYSCGEISRESYDLHSFARTFIVSLTGNPKTYGLAVVEMTKKLLPRALALLGADLLLGYKLKTKDGKSEVFVPFAESESLTERHITGAGYFKAEKEFIAQFVFSGPSWHRAPRLIDEIVEYKRRMAPDMNGNILKKKEEVEQKETKEMNGNVAPRRKSELVLKVNELKISPRKKK